MAFHRRYRKRGGLSRAYRSYRRTRVSRLSYRPHTRAGISHFARAVLKQRASVRPRYYKRPLVKRSYLPAARNIDVIPRGHYPRGHLVEARLFGTPVRPGMMERYYPVTPVTPAQRIAMYEATPSVFRRLFG